MLLTVYKAIQATHVGRQRAGSFTAWWRTYASIPSETLQIMCHGSTCARRTCWRLDTSSCANVLQLDLAGWHEFRTRE